VTNFKSKGVRYFIDVTFDGFVKSKKFSFKNVLILRFPVLSICK